MIRKTYAYLAFTLMLTTAAPALTPALPARAASYVRAEQSAKAYSPISCTLSGMLIVVREVQSAKA